MTDYIKRVREQKLFERVLKEVGDLKNIKPYNYTYTPAEAVFRTDSDLEVETSAESLTSTQKNGLNLSGNIDSFNPAKNPVILIQYRVNGSDSQAAKVITAEFLRILKTIVEVGENWFNDYNSLYSANKKEKRPIFLFGAQNKATDKLEHDRQKFAIYSRLLEQAIRVPINYKKATIRLSGKTLPVFAVQKKDA